MDAPPVTVWRKHFSKIYSQFSKHLLTEPAVIGDLINFKISGYDIYLVLNSISSERSFA